jgi:hypothetical protein
MKACPFEKSIDGDCDMATNKTFKLLNLKSPRAGTHLDRWSVGRGRQQLKWKIQINCSSVGSKGVETVEMENPDQLQSMHVVD